MSDPALFFVCLDEVLVSCFGSEFDAVSVREYSAKTVVISVADERYDEMFNNQSAEVSSIIDVIF